MADNGDAALGALESRVHFDLMLSDVMMPGSMSGRELALKVREARPDLPILFMSGYPQALLEDKGQLLPGVRLLTKPFRRSDLVRAVTDAIATGSG